MEYRVTLERFGVVGGDVLTTELVTADSPKEAYRTVEEMYTAFDPLYDTIAHMRKGYGIAKVESFVPFDANTQTMGYWIVHYDAGHWIEG